MSDYIHLLVQLLKPHFLTKFVGSGSQPAFKLCNLFLSQWRMLTGGYCPVPAGCFSVSTMSKSLIGEVDQ